MRIEIEPLKHHTYLTSEALETACSRQHRSPIWKVLFVLKADRTSIRYLKQRENDLRTIAENLPIRDYYSNQAYGLTPEEIDLVEATGTKKSISVG